MVAGSEENKRWDFTVNSIQGQELTMTEFEHGTWFLGISEVVWGWQKRVLESGMGWKHQWWVVGVMGHNITTLSQLTWTVPPTYTSWNTHVWIHFLPDMPNLNRFSNHTGLFIPTPHTIPPTQTQATRQPLTMHHMKNHSTMAKWKSQPFVCTVECTDTALMPAPQCTQAGQSDHSSVSGKAKKLISNKNKSICIMYNVWGHCTDPPTHSHREHSYSLCGKAHHPIY